MESAKVQHVSKKSSDELLRKFAATEAPKSPRKSQARGGDPSPPTPTGLAESCSLLPAPPRKSALLLRRLGIRSRAPLKGREVKHKSLFRTIDKTWRRTVEGASKVFMEKHYNRHKLLINDIA